VLAVPTLKAALVAAAVVVALFVSIRPGAAEENRRLALTISIDGAIGPASANYVKDALAKAAERHAEIVVLRLNTPGGLNTSMREIIADVLASPIPVVGYVAPSGAHAASAGTYILYATHIPTSRRWRRAPISAPRRRCRLAARSPGCQAAPPTRTARRRRMATVRRNRRTP
jgi:membrane-bound serine protease (ClpP class)